MPTDIYPGDRRRPYHRQDHHEERPRGRQPDWRAGHYENYATNSHRGRGRDNSFRGPRDSRSRSPAYRQDKYQRGRGSRSPRSDRKHSSSPLRDRSQEPRDEWLCVNCSFSNWGTRSNCKNCRVSRQQAEVIEKPEKVIKNEGWGDHVLNDSDAAMPFLVIRGIPKNVTLELLRKGMEKLYKAVGEQTASAKPDTTGAAQDSLLRVFIARDRLSDDHMLFGFAEFLNVDEAINAYNQYKRGKRFTIGSKEVDIALAHSGIFLPVTEKDEDYHTQASIDRRDGHLQRWIYRDTNYYLAELVINEPPPPPREPTPEPVVVQEEPVKKTVKKKATKPKELFAMNKDIARWEASQKVLNEDTRFFNLHRNKCFLCRRVFMAYEKLHRHVDGKLHQAMLKSPARVKRGEIRTSIKRKLEREIRRLAKKKDMKHKRDSESQESSADDTPSYKLARSMMARMGYQEGQGLGAHGTGQVETVQAATQEHRAGLGASSRSAAANSTGAIMFQHGGVEGGSTEGED